MQTLSDGTSVFAGQRDDPFFGDIGAVFDLVAIRNGTGATGGGKDFFAGYAVHSIALQVPVSMLDNKSHVIGMWTATDRPQIQIRTKADWRRAHWQQVSRLGNPLINELLIPTELKDKWNATSPDKDEQFKKYYSEPILASLLNKLYPQFGPFKETDRTDLVAVLGTGLQTPNLNFTGGKFADELRLNLSIAPTAPVGKGNRLGVLGNDLAGWPNGRRLGTTSSTSQSGRSARADRHPLPLGDGVDANDRLPAVVPVCRRSVQRLRQHEGSALPDASVMSRIRIMAAALPPPRPRSRRVLRSTEPQHLRGRTPLSGSRSGLRCRRHDRTRRPAADSRAERPAQRTTSACSAAYQQRARETGDPSWYPKSAGILARAAAIPRAT